MAWLRETAFAHRGLHGDGRAENSLAAFEAAVAAGYGIELDVRLTAGGRLAVAHDLPAPADAPALEEALALVAGRVPLLVELKDDRGIADRAAPALRGYDGALAVQSFDWRIVRRVRRLLPGVPVGQIVGDPRAAWLSRPDFLAVDLALLPKVRARGRPLLCWTVRSEAERELALLLADAIVFEGFLP